MIYFDIIILKLNASRAKKKYVKIPMPNSFKYYNDQMGRVDLCDHFLANYRVRVGSKK